MKYVILIFVILHIIKDILGQYTECSNNKDCTGQNAECRDNLCYCPAGFIYNLDGSDCIPLAIGINAECQEDVQCGWLLGKHRCNNRACECDKNWRYYEGKCIKSVGVSETCIEDKDCFNGYDLLAMVCGNEGKCVCSEGYYLRGDYDCRPAVTELGDYCSLDSDCKVQGSSCISSFCVTDDAGSNSYSSSKKTKQVSAAFVYNADCTNDGDCASLQNSFCYALTKKCACKRGFFFKSDENSCIAELGFDVGCTNDNDCEILSSRCISGRCYCRGTYFTIKSNTACQKPMTHDHRFCNTKERCYVFGTEVSCSGNTCRCSPNAELDEDYICRIKSDPGPVVPGLCSDDVGCQEVLVNSVCNDGLCICPDNYRLEDDQCLPNIGESCDDTTKLCTIENTVCEQVCTCKENYVQNSTLTCIPVATGLEGECEINSQCTAGIPNTKCDKNSCKCVEGHTSINETCYKQRYMGDLCENLKQCHVVLKENVVCKNGVCQCDEDMKPSDNGMECVENSGTFHASIGFIYVFIVILQIHIGD